jgi:hypothetical protein
MTATQTQKTTKAKTRSLRWFPAVDEYAPTAGTVEITAGKAVDEYQIAEFPTGWDGRGFVLAKTAGDERTYDVFIGRNGQDRRCNCRGFTGHGHCKHVDALAKLIGLGKL